MTKECIEHTSTAAAAASVSAETIELSKIPGDVPLDGVAFSRLDCLYTLLISLIYAVFR